MTRRTLAVAFLIVTMGVALALATLRGGVRSAEAPPPRTVVSPGAARIYLVLPGDAGRHGAAAGCGDSLVAYTPPHARGDDALRESLQALFRTPARPRNPKGSYNALGDSRLRVAAIGLSDGVADVALAGELRLRGRCEESRAEAQLSATVTQFPQIRAVRITVNGQSLEKFLRLRG